MNPEYTEQDEDEDDLVNELERNISLKLGRTPYMSNGGAVTEETGILWNDTKSEFRITDVGANSPSFDIVNAFKLSNGWIIAKFEDKDDYYIEVYENIDTFEEKLKLCLTIMSECLENKSEFTIECNDLGVSVPQIAQY